MKRFLAFSCVFLLLVTAAIGQQPGGQQPGGRGRGPGGRGAGDRGGFGGFGATGVLEMESVQEELGLNNGQKRRIKELSEELTTHMRGSFNQQDFQNFQNLSEEERKQKMDEMRQKGEAMQKAAAEKINQILDADQAARYKQIRLQRDGIRAIAQSDIADELELTPAQRNKVSKLLAESMQAFGNFGGRGARGTGGGGPGGTRRNFQDMTEDERKAAFAEMQKRGEEMRRRGEDLLTDLTNVLTTTQKSKWAELQGDKFSFPQPNFGGFGRPPADGAAEPAAGNEEKSAESESSSSSEESSSSESAAASESNEAPKKPAKAPSRGSGKKKRSTS